MVRGYGSRQMIGQAEWRQEAQRKSDCSVGKARRRELAGSSDAEFAGAVVATVAMEDCDHEHERARGVTEEKVA
jgi:hypothetical protein